MSVDIDQFIRARKQMLAEERKTMGPFPEGQRENIRGQQERKPSTPEKPIADRLIEGDLQRQRYLLERQREVQEHLKQTSPKRAVLDEPKNTVKDENAIFGLRDSATIRKRREEQRNREYNEFKNFQEEKFRNRFSHKKASDLQIRDNEEAPQYFQREDNFKMPIQQSAEEYYSGAVREETDSRWKNNEDSKIDELMRQVEELRRGNRTLNNERELKPLPSKQMLPTYYEPSFYPPGALGRRQNALQGTKTPATQDEPEGSILPLDNRILNDAQKRQMRNREYNEFLRNKGERESQRADLKRYGTSYQYEDALTQRRIETNSRVLPLGGVNVEQNLGARNNEVPFETPSYSVALSPVLKAQIMKLNEVEQRLHELEAAYDNSKLTMLSKPPRSRPADSLKGILDDEVMFGAGMDALSRFEKGERSYGFNTTRGRIEKEGATLIVGRPNSPSTKRKQQELYRRELELQMHEQAAARRRQKEMDDFPVEGKSLPSGEYGRQSQNAINRSRSAVDLRQHATTSDDDPYFYYANHNPLEGSDDAGELASRSFISRRKSQQTADMSGGRHVRFDSIEKNQNASAMLFLSDEQQKQASHQQKQDYARELSQQMRQSELEKERKKKEMEEYNRKKDEEIANFNPFGKGGAGAPMRDSSGNIVADLRRNKADSSGNKSQSPTRPMGEPSLYKPPLSSVRNTGGFDRTPRARSQSPTQLNALGEATFARGGHGIFGDPLSGEKKDQLSRYQADLQKQIAEQRQKKELEKQREREEEEREMKRIIEQQKKMAQEVEEEQRKKREKEEESRKLNEAAKLEAEQKRKEMEKKRQEEESRRLQNQRKETKTVYRLEEADNRPLPTLMKQHQEPIIAEDVANRPLPTLTQRRQDTNNEPDPAFIQISELRRQIDAERRKVEAALQEQRNHVEVYDPRIEPVTEVIVSSREPKSEDVFQRVMSKHKASPLVHRTVREPFTPDRPRRVNQENVREFKEITATHRRPIETPDSVDKFETEQQNYIKSQEESLTRYKRGKNLQQPGYPHVSNYQSVKRPPTGESMQLQSDSAFVEIPDLDSHFPSQFKDFQRKPSVDSIGKPFSTPRHKEEDKLRLMPSNNPVFGSQTSLNVEELSRKNAERLRKLQQMQADNVSLDDPEEVLNRFMSRQSSGSVTHGRPSSNRSGRGPARLTDKFNPSTNAATNEDESWLNPSRMN